VHCAPQLRDAVRRGAGGEKKKKKKKSAEKANTWSEKERERERVREREIIHGSERDPQRMHILTPHT